MLAFQFHRLFHLKRKKQIYGFACGSVSRSVHFMVKVTFVHCHMWALLLVLSVLSELVMRRVLLDHTHGFYGALFLLRERGKKKEVVDAF